MASLKSMLSQILESLTRLEKMEAAEAAHETTENADGLPMAEGANVPLAAGVDADDPKTTVHDASIPAELETSKGLFDLRGSHDFHERVEYALMGAGLSYDDAHRLATEAEHKRQRDLGFDPNEIEKLAEPFIDAAAHRAKADGYAVHPTLDMQPYRDSEVEPGEDAPDTRKYYDRDGNEYWDPGEYKALGKVSFTLAENETCVAVIEPNSGKVWLTAPTRDKAETLIDDRIRAMGLSRTKMAINAEPPKSQQQLQETYGAETVRSDPGQARQEDAGEGRENQGSEDL